MLTAFPLAPLKAFYVVFIFATLLRFLNVFFYFASFFIKNSHKNFEKHF